MVTFDVSAEESVTVTPPAGAAEGRVTAKADDWPSPMVAFEGRARAVKVAETENWGRGPAAGVV